MALKQEHVLSQRFILSQKMQRALQVLQLPVCELSALIAEEFDHNPTLEYITGTDSQQFVENTCAQKDSLFQSLLKQAGQLFLDESKLKIAELLIGHIDLTGFLTTPLTEISLLFEIDLEKLQEVLKEIQNLDPPGVGAQNLRESLLIQLKRKKLEHILAYTIVEKYFDQLQQNHISKIALALGMSIEAVRKAIEKEILVLNFRPGSSFSAGHYAEENQGIVPDIIISHVNEEVILDINETEIPHFCINPSYLEMLNDPSVEKETREYVEEKVLSGKWLIQNLSERRRTLHRIAEYLVEKESDFFAGSTGALIPLTLKEVAAHTGLNESTIQRAAANKYLACDKGLFPLRFFFSQGYELETGGSLSAQCVKKLLKEIVASEDARHPYSDEKLSMLLKEKGIPCARRTVTKYRKELLIGSQSQRKR